MDEQDYRFPGGDLRSKVGQRGSGRMILTKGFNSKRRNINPEPMHEVGLNQKES